ncbi:hypothetical protein FS749_000200, partial [Ceratobasidium sp. UAMH 11750]
AFGNYIWQISNIIPDKVICPYLDILGNTKNVEIFKEDIEAAITEGVEAYMGGPMRGKYPSVLGGSDGFKLVYGCDWKSDIYKFPINWKKGEKAPGPYRAFFEFVDQDSKFFLFAYCGVITHPYVEHGNWYKQCFPPGEGRGLLLQE